MEHSQDMIMAYFPLIPSLWELLLTSCCTNNTAPNQTITAKSLPWQTWLPKLFSFGCFGTMHLTKSLQLMQNVHFLQHLADILHYKHTQESS